MSRQLNDELYPAVVAGDAEACYRMVKENLPLVYVLVGDYLKNQPQYRYLESDLIAEGKLRVVKAVRNMVGKQVRNPNPTGFIRSHIGYAFEDVVSRECREEEELDEGTFFLDLNSDAVDLIDELQHKCVLLGIPWSVIELRLQGYTDSEIGEKLGLSQQTISGYRQQLRKLHENT